MAKRKARPVWTADQIRALGVSTDVATAGSIFGLTRTVSYDLLREGTFPVPTFKVGRRIVVPVAPILAKLGISDGAGDQPESPTLRAVQ